MKNIYNGDPRIILTPDGATLRFENGQPVMDAGLENQVIISLFTQQGWSGNAVIDEPNQQIGSDFEAAHKQAINLAALNDIRDAALKALESDNFGEIIVDVINPKANTIQTKIIIKSPGTDAKTLLITKSSINWQFQVLDPSYTKV